MVVEDMKHLFGRGLPGPAPDLSVIRGARNPAPGLESFNAVEQGVVPCLVLEIVSPTDPRIRETDEVDKVLLYARVGIPEYLLVYTPREETGHRFQIRGLRLDADGRYQPIAPDEEGCILSETTGLRFRVSPAGNRIEVFDARTGERLLSAREEEEGRKAAEEARKAAEEATKAAEEARKAAEEQAAREVQARKAAEEELQRLRAEIERLKTSGR
jgi:colicin import membrane protein